MTTQRRTVRPTDGFLLEGYGSIRGKLESWFVDPALFEARKDVLAFVVGLRFSSLLIYAIRKILNKTDLKASWGVIIPETKNVRSASFSPECDIIIHKECWVHQWNGEGSDGEPVLDFRFISQEDVKAVISCKSELFSGVDRGIRNEIDEIRAFAPRVWLFAERCPKSKVKKYTRDSKQAGYEHFWYLYTFDDDNPSSQEYAKPLWLEFARALRKLS
jgi:hypothetical protein